MLKLSQTLLITSFLWLFFSCGKSNDRSSSVIAQSDRLNWSSEADLRNSKQNPGFDDPAISRFLVPPEIAMMQAKIYVTGNSVSDVTNLIEGNADKVIKNIAIVPGCAAEIVDYQYPRELYGKKVLHDAPTYHSNLEIKTIISFDEMKTVEQRIKQLNSCLQAIPQLKLEESQKNTSIRLTVSDVIPTIRNADIYRKNILESKFARLQEIASLSKTPSQFNAADTKCTSNGTVRISTRSLSNIELDIDFKCLQFNK